MKQHRQRGLTLIEVAVLLVVVGTLVGIAAKVVSRLITTQTDTVTQTSLEQSREALTSYLRLNFQLPCPDNNGDGSGNCSARVGTLPYIDLGLDSVPVDGRGIPLVYIANGNLLTSESRDYDLCQRLYAINQLDTASQLTELHSASSVALAYLVLSGGRQDLNDDGSPLDMATLTAFGGYQAQLTSATDDRYTSLSLPALLGEFNCPALLVSVNSEESQLIATNTTNTALGFIIDNIENNIDNANTEILMAAFSIVAAAGDVASAAATMIDAVGQTTFFGNAAAMVAAASAVAGAAAAVVAVVESSIIIADAEAAIDSYEATLDDLTSLQTTVDSLCSGLNQQLTSVKGTVEACN